MPTEHLTEEQWGEFDEVGFISLGKILEGEELVDLQQRIDDIMLGCANINYDRTMMQLDRLNGDHSKVGPQSKGHKGATLDYRKIQDLEFDPIWLRYMQRPIFKEICARFYGPETSIACFRAMFMNKPAGHGTHLPWHQDRWTALDRDPLVTIYTSLDPATVANGCIKLIPGSHKSGVINPSDGSGFLTEEQAKEHCSEDDIRYFELEAGEVALLHNWTMHSSEVNNTEIPRRAFSVCYMDGRTRTGNGTGFPILFGEDALDPEELEAAIAAG